MKYFRQWNAVGSEDELRWNLNYFVTRYSRLLVSILSKMS